MDLENELIYFRQANVSLRQSLEQLSSVQMSTLQMSAAHSSEHLFKIILNTLPTILPFLGAEALFRHPNSLTLFHLRHTHNNQIQLPSVPEETLEWARERGAQSVLPMADGGVIFCPFRFENLDFGYLLVYVTDAPSLYNETAQLALEILTGQAAATAFRLWNESRLEEENARLKSSQQIHLEIVQALPQIIVALDASGHLLSANPQAANTFCRNLSTFTGMHYQMIFPVKIAETLSEFFLPIQKGLMSPTKSVRFNNFLGEPHQLKVQAIPLPMPDKHLVGMLMVGTPDAAMPTVSEP